MSQSQRATGSFDVKVNAAKPDTQVARAANLSRLTIDKRFHGDLEGISKGEMLALQTETKGSAGYVALERVTGKLKGRSGSFVLQHSATMNRGDSRAEISVVPDSASGELRGLSGKMIISVASDGTHSYEFDFRLEAREQA
jgi:predicted flavoprotein YhiN